MHMDQTDKQSSPTHPTPPHPSHQRPQTTNTHIHPPTASTRFKLMVYLRGFHETGPLIRMILQIAHDTRYFLVVRVSFLLFA